MPGDPDLGIIQPLPGLQPAQGRSRGLTATQLLDETARRPLREPRFEATIAPPGPAEAKVRDLPSQDGRDARAGVAADCLAAGLALNVVFDALKAIAGAAAPHVRQHLGLRRHGHRPGRERAIVCARRNPDSRASMSLTAGTTTVTDLGYTHPPPSWQDSGGTKQPCCTPACGGRP
jgi:hypothetical protein